MRLRPDSIFKSALLIIAFSIANPLAAQPSASGAVEFTADEVHLQDTDVYQYRYRNWENADFGQWGSMSIGSRVQNIANTRRRILVWFDPLVLSARIPHIQRVEFRMKTTDLRDNPPNPILLYRVSEPWVEGLNTYHSGTVEPNAPPHVTTWNQQPDWDARRVWARHQTTRVGDIYVWTWDITELVREWLAFRHGNFGFILVGEGEGSRSYFQPFNSSESSKDYLRPTIVVNGDGGPIVVGPGPEPGPESDLLLHFDFTRKPNRHQVTDLSGRNHHGIIHGAEWIGDKGIYLDRRGDYVEVPHPDLHSDQGLTLVVDCTPLSYNNAWSNLIWKGNYPDCTRNCENREFSLWLSNNGYAHFTATSKDNVGKGQTAIETPPGSFDQGAMITAVIDSGAGLMRIYLDGVEYAAGPFSKAGIRTSEESLFIGGIAEKVLGQYFHGYIRSVRIYGRALELDEIRGMTRPKPKNRLVAKDLCFPDNAVIRGHWGSAIPINEDVHFQKCDRNNLERGFRIRNGMFTHPGNRGPSEMIYEHDGSEGVLSGYATVLDCVPSCGRAGTVKFIIEGDGRVLWESGLIKQADPGKPFRIGLGGIRELRLIAEDGGNGNGEDWAAWLNLELESSIN
ncbi:MAG: DNRLRE domain-containing protein [Acidobacteriota bacterium]|nr:DNRLRE domain-containing protein [Acidobacteriota bacterium]